MPPKQPSSEPPEDQEEDEAPALSDLARLAAELGQAASESAEEGRVADEIFARIDRLSPAARRRLFQRPAVRALFDRAGDTEAAGSPDDPPGTIYYRTIAGEKTPWSKKPWSWSYLWEHFETRTWEPARRLDLGFQGLLVSVFPGQEVTLPAVFHAIYRDHLLQTQLGEEHRDFLFGRRHTLRDPGMVSAGGMQSRAINNHPSEPGRGNVCAPGAGWTEPLAEGERAAS